MLTHISLYTVSSASKGQPSAYLNPSYPSNPIPHAQITHHDSLPPQSQILPQLLQSQLTSTTRDTDTVEFLLHIQTILYNLTIL